MFHAARILQIVSCVVSKKLRKRHLELDLPNMGATKAVSWSGSLRVAIADGRIPCSICEEITGLERPPGAVDDAGRGPDILTFGSATPTAVCGDLPCARALHEMSREGLARSLGPHVGCVFQPESLARTIAAGRAFIINFRRRRRGSWQASIEADLRNTEE